MTSLIIHVEEPGNCPSCTSVLQREYLFKEKDRRSPLLRTLTAYCDACDRAFSVSQRLTNGVYIDEPPGVVVVRDKRKLAGIKSKVARVRGDLQLARA